MRFSQGGLTLSHSLAVFDEELSRVTVLQRAHENLLQEHYFTSIQSCFHITEESYVNSAL